MIHKYRPERFVMGPAFTEVIETYSGTDLSHFVDLTGGGGAVSLEKERELNTILREKHSGSKYLVGYGMTEISSAVTMNHNDRCKEQSIGLPLTMTNMKIIDLETGEELGYDLEGELLVSSTGVMQEYFKNQEETSKVIEVIDGKRWIHTGDLAKIDTDGFVFITGRLKRIYITTDSENVAYKLFPQRMEELIAQNELVEKCGVIVVPDAARQNVPVVFVTAKQGKNIGKEMVKKVVNEMIAKDLPSYYQPREIVVLETMPVTSSQKIDYRKLENELSRQ